MILKSKHHKNWFCVMLLAVGIASRFEEKKGCFYLNSVAISEFLATQGVQISQQKVSKCIKQMVYAGYFEFVTQEYKFWGSVTKGKKYKLNNEYRFPNIEAMLADLAQYNDRYYSHIKYYGLTSAKIFAEKFSVYCVEERRAAEQRARDLEKLKSNPVHMYYNALVAECNKFVEGYPELELRYVDSEKLRSTSGLCSTKNPEKHTHPDDRYYGDFARYDLLSMYFGTKKSEDKDKSELEKYGLMEIDVKSSIYRVTFNLVHPEKPLSPTVDLYHMIYDATYLSDYTKYKFEEDISDLWNSMEYRFKKGLTVRDLLKELSMPLYMRSCGRKNACTQYRHTWSTAIEFGHYISDETRKRYYIYKCLEKVFTLPIEEIVEQWHQAMLITLDVYRYLGKEIFWYEGDIYIQMLLNFRRAGIKCATVYDCFYFIEGTITEEQFYAEYQKVLGEVIAKVEENKLDDLTKLLKKPKNAKPRKVERPKVKETTKEKSETSSSGYTPEEIEAIRNELKKMGVGVEYY